MIVIMMIGVFSNPVFAASKERTFKVRRSTDYSVCGEVVIKTSKNDTKKGTIKFTSNAIFYSDFLNETIMLTEGTVFTYKISSMKDGGKITLTWDPSTGGPETDYVMDNWGFKMRSFSGKIHISGSNSFSHITKIDCFKANGTDDKIGFYLREN